MLPVDTVVLQAAAEFSTTAHDVVIGPVAFNYPWGDDAAGELLALAFYLLTGEGLDDWRQVREAEARYAND